MPRDLVNGRGLVLLTAVTRDLRASASLVVFMNVRGHSIARQCESGVAMFWPSSTA